MGSQGPGDIPKVVRRRAARVKRRAARKQSRAAESQYVSQGRAVEKQANRQRAQATQRQARNARPLAARPVKPKPVRAARPVAAKPLAAKPPRNVRAGKPVRTQAQAKGVQQAARQQASQAAAQRARALAAVSTSGGSLNSTFASRHAAIDREIARRTASQASTVTPAMKLLDQTTRLAHGMAAAEVSDIKRGGVKELFAVHSPGSEAAKERRKAFKRGVQLKDRSLGSDVLKAAGVKSKAARAVGGFVLDVGQDPVTGLTGGTGAVAEKAAIRASASAARKAARKGMSEAGAKTVARVAAKRAAAAAPEGKGIAVKLYGHEVPGARRATAAVARTAAKPARKVAAAGRVSSSTRNFARNFAPRIRQAGTTEAEFQAARAAARSSRARVTTQTQRAMTHATRLQRDLDPKDYAKVIDAIERNDLSRLPTKELAQHAHVLRSQLKGVRRASRRAGVAAGSNVGDVSRALDKQDLKRLERSVAAEQRAQKRRVSRSVSKEQTSRERALLTEQEGRLRGQSQQRIEETRARGRATAERERQAGRARVATEKARAGERQRVVVQRERGMRQAQVATERVRGKEGKGVAVTRERSIAQARTAVVDARRRLKNELARPVTKRKGVAVLESKVRVAEQTWRDVRRAVAPARMSAVRPHVEPAAPVSAIRPRAAEVEVPQAAAATGKRAGKAAMRYADRSADTHLAAQRLAAAGNVPKRALGESDTAWLERVVKHAKAHDLPIVRQRAEKLIRRIPTDVAKGYFPREYDERILKKLGITPKEATAQGMVRAGTPTKVVRTTQGFARKEQRRLATVNEELRAAGAPAHSENIPLVVLNHMREAARATSQGEFAKSLAKAGRPLKPGEEAGPGEAIYKLGYKGNQFGLHEVPRVPKKPTKGGQYVALNRTLKDGMQGAAVPAQAKDEVLHVWDKATGTFKRVATATIGFHVRNMIGDIGASYLETPGHRLLPNIRAAGKATARESEHARTVIPSRTEATIKVAGNHRPIDEFLKSARENGVLDAGYIGRELHDLGSEASGQLKVRSSKGVRGVIRGRGVQLDRWMTNRENLMRLATYKAALDKGMSTAKAADVANMIHVDYGELSEFERKVMRRVFPFYTWTARSLPVQAKYLVTHPGKFATIEKAREETTAGFGMNEEANRRGESEATQRQLPFVVKIGHGAAGLSASIPTTLLNELPTGASPKDLNAWMDEVGRFGLQMVSPMVRAPFELRANRILYTRQDIEDPQRPLKAAPSWVQFLPGWAKQDLHVTPSFVDKRTGKKTWGWRGKADWWFGQLPGAPQQVSQLASGGRPGQPKDLGAAISGAAGIRVDSLNAQAVKRTKEVQIFKRLAKLNQRAAELNQQGINSDHPTAEYKHLRKQINALTHQVRPLKGRKRKAGPLPLGGGGSGGKLPLGGSSDAKLPLG